jgi:microcystin-dependent protein
VKFQRQLIKGVFAAGAAVSVLAASGLASAQEPFLGEVAVFGFNFCPRGWAATEGQLLPIAQNTALFALLGTTYGGDGRTTFALPDLRGRVVLAPGAGPGLSNYILGELGGTETSLLSVAEMPVHAHNVSGAGAGATAMVKDASNDKGVEVLTGLDGGVISTQNTGGGQAHDNRQPYLAMTTCIALQGIFPSRN